MYQKNEKQKQHYVPKFYLRNFTNKKNGISTYIYSKDKFIQNASLDSVANEKYLYGKDLLIENALAQMEKKWAKSFRVIIENSDEDFTDKETLEILDDVYTFVAFQISRTLKVYDSQVDFKNFISTYIKSNSCSEENSKNLLSKYFPENFNPMLAPMEIAYFTKFMFGDLCPMILFNKSNMDFITSDNPIIKYNKFLATKHYKGNYGLGAVGLCIFFPINPKIMLCLYDPKIYFPTNNTSYFEPSKEDVLELNKLSSRNAYDSLYFTENHDESFAMQMKEFFVNNLEWKTMTAPSNLGEIIVLRGQSILEDYNLSFLTIKKASKRVVVPEFGPSPNRQSR